MDVTRVASQRRTSQIRPRLSMWARQQFHHRHLHSRIHVVEVEVEAVPSTEQWSTRRCTRRGNLKSHGERKQIGLKPGERIREERRQKLSSRAHMSKHPCRHLDAHTSSIRLVRSTGCRHNHCIDALDRPRTFGSLPREFRSRPVSNVRHAHGMSAEARARGDAEELKA